MSVNQSAYSPATGTHYFNALNGSGQWWNGSAFENYNAANWASYVITANSAGSGWYSAAFDDNTEFIGLRYQSGASPATTDPIMFTGDVIIVPQNPLLDNDNRLPADGDTIATSAELDALSGGTNSFILGPMIAQLPQGVDRRRRSTIDVAQYSTTPITIDLYDAFGSPLVLTGSETFRFVVYRENETDVCVITDVTIDTETVGRIYVNPASDSFLVSGIHRWVLWNTTSGMDDMGRGKFVIEATSNGL